MTAAVKEDGQSSRPHSQLGNESRDESIAGDRQAESDAGSRSAAAHE